MAAVASARCDSGSDCNVRISTTSANLAAQSMGNWNRSATW